MSIESEINEFIGFILEKDRTDDIDDLIVRLDRLALSLSKVEYEFDEKDYPESPKIEYNEVRKKVENRFPSLGYYNTVFEVLEIGESVSPIIGDAIDDLSDITQGLMKVSWCFQNTSENDALWHLENSYSTHWGRHLRGLQLYLYAFKH